MKGLAAPNTNRKICVVIKKKGKKKMCVECDVPRTHSTYKNIKINKGKEKTRMERNGENTKNVEIANQ